MARTVMLSDEMYKELKKLKELKNKSFSETIKDLIDSKKIRTGYDLWKLRGTMKEGWLDNEDEIREGWKSWSERYA